MDIPVLYAGIAGIFLGYSPSALVYLSGIFPGIFPVSLFGVSIMVSMLSIKGLMLLYLSPRGYITGDANRPSHSEFAYSHLSLLGVLLFPIAEK